MTAGRVSSMKTVIRDDTEHGTEYVLRADAEPACVAESLFRFIEHGDEAHRDWLRTESLRGARAYFGA